MRRDGSGDPERRAQRGTWCVRIVAGLACVALHALVLRGVRYDVPARPAAAEAPRRLTLVAVATEPPPSPAPPAAPPSPDEPAVPWTGGQPQDAPAAPSTRPGPPDAGPAAGAVVERAPPARGWTDPTLHAGSAAAGPRPRAARFLPGQAPPHATPFAMRDPVSPRDVVGAVGALLFGGGDPCAAARAAGSRAGTARADDPASAAARAGVGAVADGCDARDLDLQ